MAFRVGGVEVFSDNGALSKQAIEAARDGTATDITGTDQLVLFDGDGVGDVMRVTVDELGSKYNAVAPGGLQYTFSEANGTNSTQPGQIRLNGAQTIFAIHQDDRNAVLQSAFFGSLAPLTYLIYVSFDGGAGFFQGTYTDSTPDVFRFTSGTYAGVVPPDGANVEVTISPASTVSDSLSLNSIVPQDDNIFQITNQAQSDFAFATQFNGTPSGQPRISVQEISSTGTVFRDSAQNIDHSNEYYFSFLNGSLAPLANDFIDLNLPAKNVNFPNIDKFSHIHLYLAISDNFGDTYSYGWKISYDRSNSRVIFVDQIVNTSGEFPYNGTGSANGPVGGAPAGGGIQDLIATFRFFPSTIISGGTELGIIIGNNSNTQPYIYNANVKVIGHLYPPIP